ncbi:hypothetical protein [Comamonas testosteroni]|uniref:hypothetical protein n=1 Tax=Comamonas testosteroni TaxID=285 RepID=UPI001EE68D24|nr:hypothetical protein [Comamonas testosteroni]
MASGKLLVSLHAPQVAFCELAGSIYVPSDVLRDLQPVGSMRHIAGTEAVARLAGLPSGKVRAAALMATAIAPPEQHIRQLGQPFLYALRKNPWSEASMLVCQLDEAGQLCQDLAPRLRLPLGRCRLGTRNVQHLRHPLAALVLGLLGQAGHAFRNALNVSRSQHARLEARVPLSHELVHQPPQLGGLHARGNQEIGITSKIKAYGEVGAVAGAGHAFN